MADPSALATWANAITVGRLLLSPVMFWVIPSDEQGAWIAFVLWFVLCASDGIVHVSHDLAVGELVNVSIADALGPDLVAVGADPSAVEVAD